MKKAISDLVWLVLDQQYHLYMKEPLVVTYEVPVTLNGKLSTPARCRSQELQVVTPVQSRKRLEFHTPTLQPLPPIEEEEEEKEEVEKEVSLLERHKLAASSIEKFQEEVMKVEGSNTKKLSTFINAVLDICSKIKPTWYMSLDACPLCHHTPAVKESTTAKMKLKVVRHLRENCANKLSMKIVPTN